MIEETESSPRKEYQKTIKRVIESKIRSMSITVSEDTYDKALTAFNIAVAAAELGMDVSIFFTSRGVNIVRKSYRPRRARWGEAPISWKEYFIKKRGGPVLAELMYQAKDMGVRFYVCYTSMISTGLKEEILINDAKILRMVEYLDIACKADAQFVIG
ncbi:MAG: DsrE/DsrF/DrsH-like family protein [Candidatus Thermoplasmatota archaeon]